MVVAREDLAMEAAFWAQLPGNFGFRPRKAPITSRNFAGSAPLHNFPVGRATGNHWGEALALFATSARSPYYFSLHASDPRGGGRDELAARHRAHVHLRSDGSGKTVFSGFCVAMLAKAGATPGDLRQGPRARDPGAGTGRRVRAAQARAADRLQSARLARLADAAGVPADVVARAGRASRASAHGAGGGGSRAGACSARWRSSRRRRDGCRGSSSSWIRRTRRACTRGSRAGVRPAMASTRGCSTARRPAARTGWRTARWWASTSPSFSSSPALRTPITLYLFHRVRQALDGRRLVVWMDEFAKLLGDPAFEGFARDGLKTWRKLNAVAAFATQSPSDVLASPIARTLVEQTPTKVLFPNLEAQRAEYVDGFGLSEREFELIGRELTPGSRRFLVRQGMQGVVCELNLRGFEYELAVISGRSGERAAHGAVGCRVRSRSRPVVAAVPGRG